jgi:hypothetical protein
MAWRMAISEGGIITGFLTCVEIGSASCSGDMRGWRYIEWQYNDGTLYFKYTLPIYYMATDYAIRHQNEISNMSIFVIFINT